MPSLPQRQHIIRDTMTVINHVAGAKLSPLVASALPTQLEALLWNCQCAVAVAKGPLRFSDVVPGFGLLVFKTAAWESTQQPEGGLPQAITDEAQAAMFQLLAQAAEAVLPPSDKPLCHNYQTDDGLICVFYRMQHERDIFKATGIEFDEAVAAPVATSSAVH